MGQKKSSEIVICEICKGMGKIEKSELIDYHQNTSEYWDEECTNCEGLGRVVKEVTIHTRKLSKEEIEINESED